MTASGKKRGGPRDLSRTAISRVVAHGPTASRTGHAPGAAGAAWFAECLWGDVDDRTCRRDLADVLVGRRPRPNAAVAGREASGLLATHPGCLLVVLPLTGGTWLAAARTGHSPGSPSHRALTRRASSAPTVAASGSARR